MDSIQKIQLLIKPEDLNNSDRILEQLCKKTGLSSHLISDWRIAKRSIDARKHPVQYLLNLEFTIDGHHLPNNIYQASYPPLQADKRALIVGFGPAGMFAALELLEKGIQPIVIERGKKVRDRRRDLAILNKEGVVDENSNYCFGEGGAGTYSDGKLYTRSTKRGPVSKVLDLLVAHGASADIRVNARPHIGTNKLPAIIEAIRETILQKGGEIHFESQLIDLEVDSGKICSVELANGKKINVEHVILATGHSARDIYELLDRKQIAIEPKEFALGVRVEHPQELIDRIQYHCDTRDEHLPPAYYKLVTQAKGRGVFSFCMCPGGIIAPASTDQSHLVVNGWSPSKRNGPFANSGMVVNILPSDWAALSAEHGALAPLRYQQQIELNAQKAGGGQLVAPAQRLNDFLQNKLSQSLPACSYVPGVKSAQLKDVLPPEVTLSLQDGLKTFGKKMKGYRSNDAILVGVESRTSSPVRIPRDKQSLEHPDIKGLYPCGEGAGYAGGIVSAAIDGIRCAEQLSFQLLAKGDQSVP
jgi:uncharacterized FAD-dependent dehydrogenase